MDSVLTTTEHLLIAEGKTKKTSKLLLFLIFIFSFVFFLYLTFPYNVIKEYIASEVSKQSGINLAIGELEPNLPLGLTVKDVNVTTPSGAGAMNLKRVDVSLSLFSLLTGKAGAYVTLNAGKDGVLEIFSNLSLARALSGNPMPSTLELEAKDFPIDGLANFGIAMAARNAGQGGLLGDFIRKLRLGGELNGSIDLDIEPGDLAQSLGSLNISLKKGFFWLDDAALNIAKQNFNKAIIAANLENSQLKIDKKSGFVSQELALLFSGFVSFRQSLAASMINVEVDLELKDSLKMAIGFLIDSLTGGQDGKSKFKLSGPLLSPQREKVQG